jgi:type IV pilus assembly protein PilW
MSVRRRDAGMTLIELMVAMAIGMFLMIGAVRVFMQGRTTFRITEAVSRLQENGRFVLDTVEPDVRMAHYWGLTARSTKISNRGGPTDPNGPGDDSCGINWLIDLDNAVAAANNGSPWPWACAGQSVQASSDTLVVRRVAQDMVAAAALQPNALYIQSGRFQDGQIFVGGAGVPAGFVPATSESHKLVVHGYYVSTTSSLSTPGNLVPSLRMKTLQDDGRIVDQEVLPGVEDMQVEFGLDTDPFGTANRGSIDRYVNANDPIIDPTSATFNPDAQILAVRIWFRIRAERTENGYTDNTVYQYADQNVGPIGDGYRRTVVSKTIYLRNARPPA